MRVYEYAIRKKELDTRIPCIVEKKSTNIPELKKLCCPQEIALLINRLFDAENLTEEYVWLIGMDASLKTPAVFEISHGGMTSSSLSASSVWTRLLLCGASNFIVAHNHPCGETNPSETDIRMTKTLNKIGKEMEILMLDHIIIGRSKYFSFKEEGYF